jgi:hypothetical protein
MWQNFLKISLIIVVILLGLSILFWRDELKDIFNGGSIEKILELEKRNKEVEERNKILNDSLSFYDRRHSVDSLKIVSLETEIDSIDIDIDIIDGKVRMTKKELERIKKEHKDSKSIIEKIKNTPNTKSGDELLLSIDQKLKKIK